MPASHFPSLVLLVTAPHLCLQPKALVCPFPLVLGKLFSLEPRVLGLGCLSVDSVASPDIAVIFLSLQPLPCSASLAGLGYKCLQSLAFFQATRFLKSRVKSWCFRERSAFEVKKREQKGRPRKRFKMDGAERSGRNQTGRG